MSRKAVPISEGAVMEMMAPDAVSVSPWKVSEPAPGIAPAAIAMDNAVGQIGSIYGWAAQNSLGEGIGFLGYPYLAELSQRPEYRRISEIIAEAMTRKWIKLRGPDEKVKALEDAMRRFKVREAFRAIAEKDGFFGRSHLYIDLGKPGEDALPLIVKPEKIGKGALKAITVVEPFWCYPGAYNSTNPRASDFYRPTDWFVMSDRVHSTRLLLFVGREMPDMLKPAYQFGGLSLSQMAKPYVDNWLRTRQSVSDLLRSFSVMVLKTDLASAFQKAGELFKRVLLFTKGRDNRGLMVVDHDTEELTNVSAPLGTLDKLQAQAQEHIASVSGIPLVELLGVTPAGLNASSEGELKAYYGRIHDDQEHLFRENLTIVLNVLQLNEFGAIDPSITFEFVHLWEMSEVEKATVEKTKADTAKVYHDGGAITNEEWRKTLNGDEASPFFQQLSAPAPDDPLEAQNDDDEEPSLAAAAE